jgi:hypothetical protein
VTFQRVAADSNKKIPVAISGCARRSEVSFGDCVSHATVVAEFDERGRLVEGLDHCANLASDKSVLRKVTEKRDRAEEVAT